MLAILHKTRIASFTSLYTKQVRIYTVRDVLQQFFPFSFLLDLDPLDFLVEGAIFFSQL
jgi:hypothetical protein